MTLPNFLIIGAPRAGTTALHYLLQQHPDIYMSSDKEPRFFAFEDGKLDVSCLADTETVENLQRRSITDLERYEKLFAGVVNERAIGDASPLYLASPGAPKRIKALIPEAKIIAILRHPVDRAYSHFLQNTRGNRRDLPDFTSLLSEPTLSTYAQGKRDRYVALSLYYEALTRYLETFERQNVRIYLFENFKQNPALILKDIFQFLGVDDSVSLDTEARYNASGVSKISILDPLLLSSNPIKALLKSSMPPFVKTYLSSVQNKVLSLNSKASPRLSDRDRQQLAQQHFSADISKLQGLIDQDVSAWLADAA